MSAREIGDARRKKAPDLLEQGEGQIKQPTKAPIMSNATPRTAPVLDDVVNLSVGELAKLAAVAGMLPSEYLAEAVRNSGVTLEESIWAQSNLAHREIRFVQSMTPVEIFTDFSGARVGRRAFTIMAHTTSEGEDVFVVKVRRGAKDVDLEDAENVLREANRGLFLRAGWREIEPDAAGKARYIYRINRLYRPSIERELEAVVCDVRECFKDWHAEHGTHLLDDLVMDRYRIRILQPIDGGEAVLSVHADDDFDAAETASLLNGLQWMRAECDKINGAR